MDRMDPNARSASVSGERIACCGSGVVRTIDAVMSRHTVIRVLALSGSLRKTSSNSTLVHAAVHLVPADVEVSVYGGLADIPPFNPDLDGVDPPAPVQDFRTALSGCDALLICSPEYAHGVSGVLKNALDWIVGSGELIDKPIALVNASGRATHAFASLKETLTTMSGRVVEAASITVPLDGKALDTDALIGDRQLSALVTSALSALAAATRTGR